MTAETRYEAVAQALAMVRGHDWVGDIGTGLITHIVKIQDFESWLNRGLQEPGRHGSENEAAAHAGDETIIRMVRRARRFAGRALLALAGLTEPRVSAIR